MLIVFVVGIDKTGVYGGCVTGSALIHYFTLVAVMWMGAEAVLMFQKLIEPPPNSLLSSQLSAGVIVRHLYY